MIHPDAWRELEPLIDQLLDAPRAHRDAVARRLSGGSQARFEELMRLSSECDSDTPFLDRPASERFAGLFHEPEQAAPRSLGGYRIDREIGRGGMARVYLAEDVKHSRRVAVKVIRSELAASLGRDRFLREIAIAARLRHPNILPLFDSGDEDGMLYFVMPLEEGPSLRERLAGGKTFSVSERVNVLRDIARALSYAHDHGVVHRDVKPDNVMLSSGSAVVTDFGISTAVAAAHGSVEGGALTQSDLGIGTPAYMAPEQAVGDPRADRRADIYSFGCVGYELFAGRPPFDGLSARDTIAAHISTTAPAIDRACADVPDGVAALITQCLHKDPAARPQTAHDLLAALDRLTRDDAGRSGTAWRRYGTLATAATAVVLVGFISTYGGRDNQPPPGPADRTIAVLPLISVGGDSIQQELADGLSDEIATALFRVDGVRVVSRRGVRNYRGRQGATLETMGGALGARFLVTGSLRQVSDRLVVLVQLGDATDGELLWSERFDRSQADLGAVRDDIARAIGDTVRRVLGATVGPPRVPGERSRTTNPEAYRLYVLAQSALYRRGLSIQASIDLFRRATQLDTTYARAYSGLSMALSLSPYFGPTAADAVAAEATSMAHRALRLDTSLAQPHIALGLVHQSRYDWDSAGAEFRRAISLDPRDVEARVQYGRHLLFRNQLDDALNQFLAARAEDPASALVLSWVSYSYYVLGAMDSALLQSAHAFQSDSTNTTTLALGAFVRLKAGRTAEARQFIERGQPANESVFYVLAATGDTAEAMKRLRTFEKTTPRRWRAETNRAYAMLGAGDTARALAAFERATDAKEIWPTLESTSDPIFDPVRKSPRFQKLLRRVGL